MFTRTRTAHFRSHLSSDGGTISRGRLRLVLLRLLASLCLPLLAICGSAGCLLLSRRLRRLGFTDDLDGVSCTAFHCFHFPILDWKGTLERVVQELVLLL